MSKFKAGDKVRVKDNADNRSSQKLSKHIGETLIVSHGDVTIRLNTEDGSPVDGGWFDNRFELIEGESKMEYQPGDEVRMRGSSDWEVLGFPLGSIATVVEQDTFCHAILVNKEGKRAGFSTDWFELSKENADMKKYEFQPGDKVRMTRDFDQYGLPSGALATIKEESNVNKGKGTNFILINEEGKERSFHKTYFELADFYETSEPEEPVQTNNGLTIFDGDVLGELVSKGWEETLAVTPGVRTMIDAQKQLAVMLYIETGTKKPTLFAVSPLHETKYQYPSGRDLPTPEEALDWWQKQYDSYSS